MTEQDLQQIDQLLTKRLKPIENDIAKLKKSAKTQEKALDAVLAHLTAVDAFMDERTDRLEFRIERLEERTALKTS